MRRLHEARNSTELLTIEEDIAGRFLGEGGEPGILDDLGGTIDTSSIAR
jgi:hypothetical protein